MIALQEGAVDFEQRSDFDPERRVSDFPVIGSGIRRSIKRACREVSTLPSISEVNQYVAGQVFSATHTTALPRCAAQRFSTGATEIGPFLPVGDRQLSKVQRPVSRFAPELAASECRAVVISAQRSAAFDP
jgi:hypothetical protein